MQQVCYACPEIGQVVETRRCQRVVANRKINLTVARPYDWDNLDLEYNSHVMPQQTKNDWYASSLAIGAVSLR